MNTVEVEALQSQQHIIRNELKCCLETCLKKKKKQYKCAPGGLVSAFTENAVDNIQYANREVGVLTRRAPKTALSQKHKEEFMMRRNKAGRNHCKHLTRKLNVCFCQGDGGLTHVCQRRSPAPLLSSQ
ncbi:hypothetical protein FQA47_011917 [Oryzias melastigma]|uniref:Uncharacterized protein n=1 Tax=Oryzias melastigma TaxID=30732 RepID=A0A834FAG2_ORYME|nr:hypothetical protein FQA47_011917 [Oryzias melastigma]